MNLPPDGKHLSKRLNCMGHVPTSLSSAPCLHPVIRGQRRLSFSPYKPFLIHQTFHEETLSAKYSMAFFFFLYDKFLVSFFRKKKHFNVIKGFLRDPDDRAQEFSSQGPRAGPQTGKWSAEAASCPGCGSLPSATRTIHLPGW